VTFPIAEDRYRIVADAGVAPENSDRPAEPTLEDVQAILDKRFPGGVRASNPFWLSSFRINERKVADYRAGGVFLAGDAAHVHSPAGGQGMNTGMQDACNLTWKLALVVHRIGSESLLDKGAWSDGRHLLKLQAQLAAVKLLIVDELGYVPLSQIGAEVLFEIFSQRHERGSTIARRIFHSRNGPPSSVASVSLARFSIASRIVSIFWS
jgi:hypothetical protein